MPSQAHHHPACTCERRPQGPSHPTCPLWLTAQPVPAQLLGFSDWATGTLTVCTTLGAALGFLIGGALSDCLAWRFPDAARPFINQLSAAMALPLTVVLYKAAPGAPAAPLRLTCAPQAPAFSPAAGNWSRQINRPRAEPSGLASPAGASPLWAMPRSQCHLHSNSCMLWACERWQGATQRREAHQAPVHPLQCWGLLMNGGSR